VAEKNNRVSLKVMVAAVALAMGVASTVAALMGSIYCTKSDLAVVKELVKDDIADVKLKVAKADWKDQTMATRIQNIERRQIQMGENLAKLLARLRVQPVDPPYLSPMPAPPGG
jgi:hypothetical protein